MIGVSYPDFPGTVFIAGYIDMDVIGDTITVAERKPFEVRPLDGVSECHEELKTKTYKIIKLINGSRVIETGSVSEAIELLENLRGY